MIHIIHIIDAQNEYLICECEIRHEVEPCYDGNQLWKEYARSQCSIMSLDRNIHVHRISLYRRINCYDCDTLQYH